MCRADGMVRPGNAAGNIPITLPGTDGEEATTIVSPPLDSGAEGC